MSIKDLVSVQPMQEPDSKIFYMDIKYDNVRKKRV